MISVILYGRNDNYGYNLHKRAALSFNCIAEVLSDPEDEILFVDYNTPDDFPTFPEAIADTLTDQARRLLRILRVRPAVHDQLFAKKTHLKAIEPVSRNIAARRSNPTNKWILSTNTDMIFVTRDNKPLSELCANLEGGFYCAPRLEIPETLWESFNRYDPQEVIQNTRVSGEQFHLNEIVYGAPEIRYDGPGDFQLIRRKDLFEIDGFHEEMLVGWHVDSNISKRLYRKYGEVSDAFQFVIGYHCDHTRQITPMHAPKAVQNDPVLFIDLVDRPDIPQQRATWGLPDIDIEEISLSKKWLSLYDQALRDTLPEPQKKPIFSTYNSSSFDQEPGHPNHILPFLLDLFSSETRAKEICWLGAKDDLLKTFSTAIASLGFISPVAVINDGDLDSIPPDCSAVVINFGMAPKVEEDAAVHESLEAAFFDLLVDEASRPLKGLPLRKIIAVNAIHNRFEWMVQATINCSKTPFSARILHGYLNNDFSETFAKSSGARTLLNPRMLYLYFWYQAQVLFHRLRSSPRVLAFSRSMVGVRIRSTRIYKTPRELIARKGLDEMMIRNYVRQKNLASAYTTATLSKK